MAWTEPHGRGYRGAYRDPRGATQKTETVGSKRKALQLAQDHEAKVRAGTWFDSSVGKVTFADYFEKQWFPNRGGEQTTRDTYLSHYNATLEDRFGDMELRRILPLTVQGWVTEMTHEGVRPSTIQAKVKALQTVLAAKKGSSAMRQPHRAQPVQRSAAPDGRRARGRDLRARGDRRHPRGDGPVVADGATAGVRDRVPVGRTDGPHAGLVRDQCRSVRAARTVVETKIANTGNGTRFMWKDYPKGRKVRDVSLRADPAEAVKFHIADRGLGSNDRLFSMPDRRPPADWHPPLTLVWTPDRDSEAWPGGLPISRAFFRQSV